MENILLATYNGAGSLIGCKTVVYITCPATKNLAFSSFCHMIHWLVLKMNFSIYT